MTIGQRKALIKAVKTAAIIEVPLFVGLAVSMLVFKMGPHDPLPMILLMTQMVGLAAMSPLERLDSSTPVVLAAIWTGMLAVQMGVVTLIVYWMLRAVSDEDEATGGR